MQKSLSLLLSLLLVFSATSQVENVVGSNYTIPSEVYNQERSLLIYTPESYYTSQKEYPVLYLLDGQRWFLQAVSYQQLFAEYEYTPEFIVVGINTEDSPRYQFFAERETLTAFIQNEVIPFVDTAFRTSTERILFGWQFAGAFVLNTLDKNTSLFNSYLAASPIPIDQNEFDISAWSYSEKKSLLITTSQHEAQVNVGVNRLVDSLQQNTQKILRWERKMMRNETISSFGHRTTPLGALYHGLRFYYDDYPLLEFDRLENFNQAGGIDYVYKYYEERGRKYKLPSEIPHEGMFFLVRLGLDADHFPTFSRFMSDFIDQGFLENVNLGWGSGYAEFYLKYDDTDGAKKVYDVLVRRFSQSARPVNGLGNVHYKKGNLKLAEEYYRKAIAMAEKNGDRRLASYQKDLQQLISQIEND